MIAGFWKCSSRKRITFRLPMHAPSKQRVAQHKTSNKQTETARAACFSETNSKLSLSLSLLMRLNLQKCGDTHAHELYGCLYRRLLMQHAKRRSLRVGRQLAATPFSIKVQFQFATCSAIVAQGQLRACGGFLRRAHALLWTTSSRKHQCCCCRCCLRSEKHEPIYCFANGTIQVSCSRSRF